MIAVRAPHPDHVPADTPAEDEPTTVAEYGIRYTRHRDGGTSVTNYGRNLDMARNDLAARATLGRDAELVTHTITTTPWIPVEA